MKQKKATRVSWKSAWRDHLLHKWFQSRLRAATQEYMTKMADSPHLNEIVYYKGVTFNPTTLNYGAMKKGVLFEVEEGTEVGDILERHMRIKNDITDATGMLTYVLNFCDDPSDIRYLLGLNEEGQQPQEDLRLEEFKKANQEKFQAFKRYQLLADMA